MRPSSARETGATLAAPVYRLWQSEDHQTVAIARTVQERAASGHHRDVLLAVCALVGDGRSMGGIVQLLGPDFLPRRRVEGTEAAVIGGADEGQPAGGGERRTQAGPAGILLSFRHGVGDAQVDAPSDLAGIDVDRVEIAPGRVLARPIPLLFLDEETVRAGGRTPIALLLLLQLLDRTHFIGIDDEIAQLGIEGAAAPFRPAAAAGEARDLRIHGQR